MTKLMAVTHDKNGKLAWQSVEQCLSYVQAYGRRSSTPEQQMAVAEYMLKHNEAVFNAENFVLSIAPMTGHGLQMAVRIL